MKQYPVQRELVTASGTDPRVSPFLVVRGRVVPEAASDSVYRARSSGISSCTQHGVLPDSARTDRDGVGAYLRREVKAVCGTHQQDNQHIETGIRSWGDGPTRGKIVRWGGEEKAAASYFVLHVRPPDPAG